MGKETTLKIAAFGGFRGIPPSSGGAGSDKFAVELYPRLAERGCHVIAYCRIYPGDPAPTHFEYRGVELKYYRTVKKAGFDTLVHSFKATFDIIFHNRASVVHLHSGANSIWALFLRIAGKRVVVTQFAMDWKRDKWPWYGKLFYRISSYLTAWLPSKVAFDNIFTREYFEKKFSRKYDFIPYGAEVPALPEAAPVLDKLGLKAGDYFLFVGRFIPDKGLHLLIEAFMKLKTDKKLVLLGGPPHSSEYSDKLLAVKDDRILFPGFLYGEDTNQLIRHAYVYVQPSLIEGLSPVILTVMGLGTSLLCSDIPENTFITKENATTFRSGDADDLYTALNKTINERDTILQKARLGQADIKARFNWEIVTDQYLALFRK